MDKDFIINEYDEGLSKTIKREASIILASLEKDSSEYLVLKRKYLDVLSVIKAIEHTEITSTADVDFILNTISKVWNVGVLSHLTLQDDEFYDLYMDIAIGNKIIPLKANKRYLHIYKDKDGNVYNLNAYNLIVRAEYNHTTNKQVPCNVISVPGNKIYISKGGVITGEYIHGCKINKNAIDRKCYTIQSVVKIPVCGIINRDNDDYIFVVDHREPKLKVLKEFYDVDVLFDENIANRKYNIRKYTKLK